MIAVVVCVLLFSGRLAAAEKTFSRGAAGGYGGGVETPAATTNDQGGYSGGGGEATPASGGEEASPASPTTDGGGEATPASGGEEASSASPTTDGGQAAASGGGSYDTATPSTPAESGGSGGEASPTPADDGQAAAAAGGYGKGSSMDAAGEPEVGMSQKAIDDIVREHNVFRAKEKVPPLKWNATLAKFAQDYAEKLKGECKMVHSTSPYGENLMQATGGITWKTTIDAWSEEKKNYHYGSNTCDPGQMCGHYTAVVWKGTTTLGCGRVKCNNGDNMEVCSYWPPGNYDGEKPY